MRRVQVERFLNDIVTTLLCLVNPKKLFPGVCLSHLNSAAVTFRRGAEPVEQQEAGHDVYIMKDQCFFV